MKIRLDYVSNSSSSSFIIYGNKIDTGFEVEMFDELKEGEEYFICLPNAGMGGYDIFCKLTSDLLLKCDIHGIDIHKKRSEIDIYKVSWVIDCQEPIRPTQFHEFRDMWTSESLEREPDKVRKIMESANASISGLKLYEFDKDTENPDQDEFFRNLRYANEIP